MFWDRTEHLLNRCEKHGKGLHPLSIKGSKGRQRQSPLRIKCASEFEEFLERIAFMQGKF